MRTLIPLLIVLACPLMMIFMLWGMHGNHDNNERIAELEREVAALHEQAGDRDAPAGRR